MNQEIKKQWVKALRSGKYQQGKNHLRVGNEFCCLGVLCDIAPKSVREPWKPRIDNTYEVKVYSMHGISSCIPDPIKTWANLTDGSIYVPYNGTTIALSYLNDNGISFNEIADLIEEHL